MSRARLLGVCAMLLLAASTAEAQRPHPTLEAQPRGDSAIQLDGVLDEAPWTRAAIGSHFVERLPIPGAHPPVDSEVRVLYDHDALYIGITMHLLPGESPRGLTYQRDAYRIWDDDAVTLKFDVRHDHRTTVGFATNILGAQLDYISTDNGRSFRREYDAVWEVGTQVNADSWVAEFRIPAEALGLSPDDDARTIGFDVSRDHNARMATDDWSLIPPEFGSTSALHYGEITGVTGIGGGHLLSLIPYAAGTYLREPGGDGTTWTPNGGGDIRMRIANDVWGQATILTDFAEVDLDDATINLNRFPLFFPERRPFFLSGADVFEFGEAGVSQLFFSRRIGLDANGRTVPILGGIKTYGRVGNTSFGILDVATQATSTTPASNMNVLRLRQNIGESSFVGAILAMREYLPVAGAGRVAPFTADPSISAGVDGLARFFDDRLSLTGYAAFTRRTGEPLLLDDAAQAGDGGSGRIGAAWLGQNWTPSLSMLYVSDEFRPELGFVRRRGILQTRVEIPYLHRFKHGVLRSYTLGATGQITRTDEGDANLGSTTGWDASITTRGRWEFLVGADYESDTVETEFTLVPGVVIAPGSYRGATMHTTVTSPSGRNPAASVYYEVTNSYFGGIRHYLFADLALWLGPHFRVTASSTNAWITLPGHPAFNTTTLNSDLTIAINANLTSDFVVQVNNVAKIVIAYARVRWRFQPGSDVFLVYREDVDFSDDGFSSIARSLTLKASYRFDALL